MMSFRAAMARRANTSSVPATAAAVTATAARNQSSTTQGGIGYVSFPKSTVSASTPTFSRGGMTGTGHDQYKLSDVHYDARRYAVKKSEFAAPDTDKIDLFTLNRHQLEPGVFDPTTAGGRLERAKNVKRAKAKDIDRMWTPPSVAGVAATAFSQVKPMEDQYAYTRHSPFTLESKITAHEIKPTAAKRKAAGGAAAKRKSTTAAQKKAAAAAPAAPLYSQVSEYEAWKNLNSLNAIDAAPAKKEANRAYSPKAAVKRKRAAPKAPALAFGPKAIRVERTASLLGLSPEEAATHRASITNTRGLRSLRAAAERAAREASVVKDASKAQAQFDAVDARTSRAALRDAGNAAIDAATKRTARLMGGKMPEAYSSAAYMRKQPEKYAAPTWGNVAAADDGAHYAGASPYDTQTPESSMMFLGGAAVIGFGVLAMLYARDYRLHHQTKSRDPVARYGNRYLTEGEDAMLIEDTAGAAAANNGRNANEAQPARAADVKRTAPPKPAPPTKMVAPAEDAGAWGRVKKWADETVDESVAKTHV